MSKCFQFEKKQNSLVGSFVSGQSEWLLTSLLVDKRDIKAPMLLRPRWQVSDGAAAANDVAEDKR